MSKSTVHPHDKKQYDKVKGQMKKKGKTSGGDPKAFNNYKKKLAEFERRQRDKRRSEMDKLLKRVDGWKKDIDKLKADRKLPDEKKVEEIANLVKDMLAKVNMSPAMKAATDKVALQKEVLAKLGEVPTDKGKLLQYQIDAMLKEADEERKRTQVMIKKTAVTLRTLNQKLAAGQTPDLVLLITIAAAIINSILKFRDKNK